MEVGRSKGISLHDWLSSLSLCIWARYYPWLAPRFQANPKECCLVAIINHQKGGDCKCIWPLKWVLMLIICTIKELMCLLSNEQDQKSLKWKRSINDAIFSKEMVYELHWKSFINFHFEFEYIKHRTIKGAWKDCLEMPKCLTKMLTTNVIQLSSRT